MDRRYQVFLSSTYSDLEEERQHVMQVLLELDAIPSGMELFPAANEEQWELIKKVIDDCDYYIVIIAGRYGSIGHDGISYTEMEYRYALEQNKPTIAFIHKDPGMLLQKRCENDSEKILKLKEFCDFVKKKHCKMWSSPADLAMKVGVSFVKLTKNFPATGWVRADKIANEQTVKEILKLQNYIGELEEKISILENADFLNVNKPDIDYKIASNATISNKKYNILDSLESSQSPVNKNIDTHKVNYKQSSAGSKIKFIGIGGGGCNVINRCAKLDLKGVSLIAANTDEHALHNTLANTQILLGENLTKGLGAGSNIEIGYKAACESIERIKKYINGADMLFLAAGMGGGTGSGAAPVVARLAKELGILTVGVVTKPFTFEGKKRTAIADSSISELRNHVDALVVLVST